MIWLPDAAVSVRDFFEAGGWVLWAIFAATVLMWAAIIERLWFFLLAMPRRIAATREAWDSRADQRSWCARRIREQLISAVSLEANRSLMFIRALMMVLPLLGLMGTVWGMIEVFEVMSYVGTGDARAMAGGVYKATLPTMAGLVAALSGLYPSSYLTSKASRDLQQVEDLLVQRG